MVIWEIWKFPLRKRIQLYYAAFLIADHPDPAQQIATKLKFKLEIEQV